MRSRTPQPTARQAVLEFFEDLGLYLRRGYLDPEMVASGFGYYAAVWWAAIRGSVTEERKASGILDLYDEFEGLIGRISGLERKRPGGRPYWLAPGTQDVDDFLRDEAFADGSELTVEVRIGGYPGAAYSVAVLIAQVTNTGSGPMVVSAWGFSDRKGDHRFPIELRRSAANAEVEANLPRRLAEADHFTLYRHSVDEIDERLVGVWVEDGRGRKWHADARDIQGLLEAKKLLVNREGKRFVPTP